MCRKGVKFAAVVAVFVAFGPSAYASTLVYNDTTAPGNLANYNPQVANSFTVTANNVVVFDLAVFDSPKTTIMNNLYVGLYNDTTKTAVINFIDFNGTAYNGGGSYFVTKAVAPVTLVDGDTYSVEAYGFGGTFLYFDSSGPSKVTFNGAGLLTNLNSSNNVGPGTLCVMSNASATGCTASPNGGSLHIQVVDDFGAGSLVVEQTPLPSTWLLMLGGLVGLSFFAYRGTKKNATALAAA
jgi:hypothetical protein